MHPFIPNVGKIVINLYALSLRDVFIPLTLTRALKFELMNCLHSIMLLFYAFLQILFTKHDHCLNIYRAM